jgi:hypothetical protein
MKVKISREARILFGLMCLAAAILIWVNFFTSQRQGFGGLFGNQEANLAPSASVSSPATSGDATVTTPDVVALEGAQDSTAVTNDANGVAVSTPDVATADVAGIDMTTPSVDVAAVSPDGTVVTTPNASAPTAAITPTVAATAPTAARDVQLAELPFLVTEAPVAIVTETTEDVLAAETTRPGEQRATINPFSPIVLAPVEAPVQTVGDAPPQDAGIQVVDVPTGPQAITPVNGDLAVSVQPIETGPIVAEGPLPEAVIPAPAVASLPRPLPGGTLPVAPDILRNMSRTPSSVTLGGDEIVLVEAEPQIVEVPAAIREPGQVATSVAPAIFTAPTASTDSAEVELEPVGSMASAATSAESVASGAPLFVGASPLSSYLRNNDVRFTGYAIGAVSVGIFRSKLSANPVVVPLGQSLPETEFVLTSLQGKEAEFSYGQEKQPLTLDLRR